MPLGLCARHSQRCNADERMQLMEFSSLSTGVYWSLSTGVSLLDSLLESFYWSLPTEASPLGASIGLSIRVSPLESLYWSLSLLKPLASNRANPTQALERCDRSHSHSLGKSVCHFLCADWLDRCACLFTFERSCKHQPNSRYIIGLKVEFDIAYLPRIFFFVNHSK